MSKEEIISQLKSLISDRESFITNEEDCIFKKDKRALEEAIKLIKKQEKMIDLMIEWIDGATNEVGCEPIDDKCSEFIYCSHCIRNYFEKKASEEDVKNKG